MRNRAKCKLCKDIIESFHQHDYVTCKCGEIAIDGGNYNLRAVARDFKNFLRVDDKGNEIVVQLKDAEDVKPLDIDQPKPTRKDILDMLEETIKGYERLPQRAMYEPITHSDFIAALLLILASLRAE